jgi:hypothetical protein
MLDRNFLKVFTIKHQGRGDFRRQSKTPFLKDSSLRRNRGYYG